MKKIGLFVFVACFIAATQTSAVAEGFWKRLKASLPSVQINNPVTRRPVATVSADGVKRVHNPAIAEPVPAMAANSTQTVPTHASDYDDGTGGQEDNAATAPSRTVEEITIVPPDEGREQAIPNFTGTVVAVGYQSGSPRNIELEKKVQKEFAKRGASFARAPINFSGDPCRRDKPTICVAISKPMQIGGEDRNGSFSSYEKSSSSSSSSSDGSGKYFVTVSAVLVDGDVIELLGATSKTFDAQEHVSSHGANSTYNQNGGYSSSGGSSTSYNPDIAMWAAASDAAKSAVDHLLKKKGDWLPGAAELIRRAFGK